MSELIVYELTSKEHARLACYISHVVKNDKQANPWKYFATLTKKLAKEQIFSLELTNLLKKLGKISEYCGVIVKNTFVEDNLPETPNDDQTPREKTWQSELNILYMLGLAEATPYIEKDEKNCQVFQNVAPMPGQEDKSSSRGSKIGLSWHTENRHSITPPDILALLCLREDKNAKTMILPVNRILENLNIEVISELMQKNFIFSTGNSFHSLHTLEAPIISQEKGNYTIRFSAFKGRVEGCSSKANRALNTLKAFLDQDSLNRQLMIDFVLEKNDMLLLANKFCLHKRNGFEISTSFLQRRWLERCYAHK